MRVERIKVLRSCYQPPQLALEYIRELQGQGFEIVEEKTDGHPNDVPAWSTILEREKFD